MTKRYVFNGVEYPELKPCPSCGELAEYPYAVTYPGEFHCSHCGAYHPGDCGYVRPGYFRIEDGAQVHYMTSEQAKQLQAHNEWWQKMHPPQFIPFPLTVIKP